MKIAVVVTGSLTELLKKYELENDQVEGLDN